MSQAIRGGMLRGGVPSGLSIALALLPKCPLCIAAHASVVGGTLGAGTAGWMRGVAAGAVLLAVAMLAIGARSRRGYGPFGLGCAGAALVLMDVFHLHPGGDGHAHAHAASASHSHWMLWMGIAAMVSASVWNAWPRRAAPACHAAHG
jgi:hypothetical protein